MTLTSILPWLIFAGTLIPAVVAIIKTTAWGKAHREALDAVVDAVGQAKAAGLPATEIMKIMTGKEATAALDVINAWKDARDRVDPKPVASSK